MEKIKVKLKLLGKKKRWFIISGKEPTIILIFSLSNVFIKYFSSLKHSYIFKEITYCCK